MSENTWIVVGGGINGIVAAHLLARRGERVSLIEPGPTLGGGLRSVAWKGFHLDRGCHLFSNESDAVTDVLLDILGRDFEPVSVSYASIFNGVKSEGFAIPNLTSIRPTKAKNILSELICAASMPPSGAADFREELNTRFGPTAGAIFGRMTQKMFRCKPELLSPDVLRFSPFRRIKFLDDRSGELLKQAPALDERIAVGSSADPLRFVRNQAGRRAFKNFYPRKKGMTTFCDRAERRLRRLKVEVHTGCAVGRIARTRRDVTLALSDGGQMRAENVFWSGGPVPLASALGLEVQPQTYLHGVPMVAHYFVIRKRQESGYTYLQNFDCDDPWFRAAIPGGYVRASACPDGLSYVCCEVPARIGSRVWKAGQDGAEAVWQSLREHDFVRGRKPVETLTVRAPKTFLLPKKEFPALTDQIEAKIGRDPRIVWSRTPKFSKNDIISSVLEALQ